MTENHKESHRGGSKFWACVCFGILFFCMLCYIICKLNMIEKKIEDIECCCEPIEPSNDICIDTFITSKVNPLDSTQSIPDTILQKYYCSQIVVSGVNSSNQGVLDSLMEAWGLVEVKSCACDSIIVLGGDTPLSPEQKGQICRSEIGQEGDGFFTSLNYVLEVPIDLTGGITDRKYEPISQRSGRKVKVAIIDTGINFEHDSLRKYQWTNQEEETGIVGADDDLLNCLIDDSIGYDFVNELTTVVDSNGHGTHIAGIIARKSSINFDLELMNLKVIGENSGDLFHLLCALQYAINEEADIINTSLGFYALDLSAPLGDLLKKTEAAKILVVTSAGNKGFNNDNISINGSLPALHQPSSFNTVLNNILSVAALKENSQSELWIDSNYGSTHVDVATRGVKIISTYIDISGTQDNPNGILSGTSMAAGYISHIATILLSQKPTWDGLDAKNCIENKANNLPIGGIRAVKHGGLGSVIDANNCN